MVHGGRGGWLLTLGLILAHVHVHDFASVGVGTGEETLRVVKLPSRLPVPLPVTTPEDRDFKPPFAIYDQNDTIYVIGAFHHHRDFEYEVVKYSIAQDTFTLLSGRLSFGYPVWGGSGIYMCQQIGRGAGQGLLVSKVIFDHPDQGNSFRSAPMVNRQGLYYKEAAPVWIPGDSLYVITGRGPVTGRTDELYRISAPGNRVSWVGALPAHILNAAEAVYDPAGRIYIFDFEADRNWIVYTTNWRTGPLNMTWPPRTEIGRAFWASGSVYMFYKRDGSDGKRDWHMAKWDPDSVNSTAADVQLVGDTSILNTYSGLAATYVPKLNRIYAFGGAKHVGEPGDQVMYIDFNRASPSGKSAFSGSLLVSILGLLLYSFSSCILSSNL